MIKKILKLILKKFNLKIIKTNFKRPKVHPYPIPTDKEIEIIKSCKGILHVGAHRGTEAGAYDWFNKKVIWIEADPEIYEDLEINIRKHYNQKSYCALLGSKNQDNVNFYISNNDSACSSIYQFSKEVKNKKLWNERLFFTSKKKTLEMKTLDSLVKEKRIDISEYNYWMVDIQGAELEFLKGALESLKSAMAIQVEISKENYYEGGVQWEEIKKFLNDKNFQNTTEPNKPHTEILFLKNGIKLK